MARSESEELRIIRQNTLNRALELYFHGAIGNQDILSMSEALSAYCFNGKEFLLNNLSDDKLKKFFTEPDNIPI